MIFFYIKPKEYETHKFNRLLRELKSSEAVSVLTMFWELLGHADSW